MDTTHTKGMSAFGHWLQLGLAQQHNETLREPLPEAWLKLLDARPKD